MTRKIALIALLLLALTQGAATQSPECTSGCVVYQNRSFTAVVTPGVVDATHGAPDLFRAYIDGALVMTLTAPSSGDVYYNGLVVTTTGPHTLRLSAANAGGEAFLPLLDQPAISFTAEVCPSNCDVPGAPTNIRVIRAAE